MCQYEGGACQWERAQHAELKDSVAQHCYTSQPRWLDAACGRGREHMAAKKVSAAPALPSH